ncbi:MAG: restriction endonuclease subunit S [Opitutales bacterium]|nr:restriction endonuclease subunit S [Opitutales bacterium]
MPENSLKNKTDYKRLGDYIREVDSRNRDLAVTKLVGLTIDKAFIPSVANVIGTDLSNYKVIRREQFACSLMQVSRDGKIPIAMFEEESAIMSPVYPMFEVIDTGTLLPKYLMMWFSRKEFDREASFYAVGGVRGSLTWEDFCDLRLPIPPISRQREIVAEYETLTRRIRLNERLISTLESSAQTLYRRTFVDNIDPARLPPGWRSGTLREIAEINPRLSIKKGEDAFFVEMEALPTKGFFIQEVQRREFSGGAKFQNGDVLFARITPCMENGKVAVVSEIPQNEVAFGSTEFIVLRGRSFSLSSFLATLVRSEEFRSYAKSHMKGTDGRQRVDSSALEVYKITIPPGDELKLLERKLSSLVGLSLTYMRENKTLTKIQNLLLAKIGE